MKHTKKQDFDEVERLCREEDDRWYADLIRRSEKIIEDLDADGYDGGEKWMIANKTAARLLVDRAHNEKHLLFQIGSTKLAIEASALAMLEERQAAARRGPVEETDGQAKR